jgi:hypothetical protein
MCMACGCDIPNDKKSTVMIDGKVKVTHNGGTKQAK